MKKEIQKQILDKIKEILNGSRYTIQDVTIMVERLAKAHNLLNGK